MSNQIPESPGFAPDAPTDGRKKGDWKTRYPPEALKMIYWESAYLGAMFILMPCLFLFVLSLDTEYWPVSVYPIIAWIGGTFGGVIFDIKWTYHSVAKYLWNEDRRLWRLFTPHISGGLSFSMIILISSGLINIFDKDSLQDPYTVFGIGFLTGYFSDMAIGKLSEVAKTFFGATEKASHQRITDAQGDEKSSSNQE